LSEPRIDWTSPYELLASLQLGDVLIGLFPGADIPWGWTWVDKDKGAASILFTGSISYQFQPEPTVLFRARPGASPTEWAAPGVPMDLLAAKLEETT
jgi:hypothetical protein